MTKHTNKITHGILNAIGIFGGTQVFTILLGIIRTKLVAIWIGPVGMGLFGLYSSVVDMMDMLTNMSIRDSSVRDISVANSSNSREKIVRIVKIVRRWSWAMGVIGAFVMLACSPMFSRLTFGNSDHTWEYMALSVCVFTFSIINCEQAVLQGTQKLRRLAYTMTVGVAVGLAITVPLYYFLRLDGIMPSIIVYAVSNCLVALVFRNRDFDKDKIELTVSETVKGGANFVRLGIFITLSSFIMMLGQYIFMIYLNHSADTAEVGLFQAGNALVYRYAMVLFSAIGLEYYPRLANICHSKLRLRVFVSQEVNILLYIIVPVAVLFLLFRELIVDILYSEEFHVMIPFISWCMVGLVFKGVQWCVSYVLLAKGESKIFLATEVASAVVGLALNISFYELWGLEGLGISYTIWYFLYMSIVLVVYFGVFKLKMHRSVLAHILYAVVVAMVALWAINDSNYFVIIALAVATMAISFIKIRKSFA